MSAPRLSLATVLEGCDRSQAPHYDPMRCSIGIVHLGVGNFHRAHQAAHIHAALNAGETNWAISGWSLRRDTIPAALGPQDGLYTLLTRGSRYTEARVLAPLREIGHAPSDPSRLIDRIASPATRILTLTITEKGYTLGAKGDLDRDDTALVADLAGAWPPQSALGWLAAGMAARQTRAPEAPLTIVSCDNLSANGQSLAKALDAFLRASARHWLADWVSAKASFPNSMVDRIVPATTDHDRELAQSLTGLVDACPVATEPFSQWVIEDRFIAGRPRLESSGVQFSDDVHAWEQMKLRLLNAAHSAIAYLGVVAGWATVDTAMREPRLQYFIKRLWVDEAIPTLPEAMHAHAPAYCRQLLERFGNAALSHRTLQIAADGSKKIPLRWLPSLKPLVEQGRDFECLALALAAWVRALEGKDEAGRAIAVADPFIARLTPLASQADARLAVKAVFGTVPGFTELAHQHDVCAAVSQALDQLRAEGVCATLATVSRPQ